MASRNEFSGSPGHKLLKTLTTGTVPETWGRMGTLDLQGRQKHSHRLFIRSETPVLLLPAGIHFTLAHSLHVLLQPHMLLPTCIIYCCLRCWQSCSQCTICGMVYDHQGTFHAASPILCIVISLSLVAISQQLPQCTSAACSSNAHVTGTVRASWL